METIGAIIDRLATTNQKMFMEQEKLYSIKRMSLQEFERTLRLFSKMCNIKFTTKRRYR